MYHTEISRNEFAVKNCCKLTEHLIFISFTINLPNSTFSTKQQVIQFQEKKELTLFTVVQLPMVPLNNIVLSHVKPLVCSYCKPPMPVHITALAAKYES